MSEFARDYFILVFVASTGVVQIAASMGRLDGLLFFKHPLLARVLGLALILAAVIWFFLSDTRNINDYSGGLDANSQARIFFLACLASVAANFIVSSLVNRRMRRGDPVPEGGLDALRRTSYLTALRDSLGYWRRAWPRRIKEYFFG